MTVFTAFFFFFANETSFKTIKESYRRPQTALDDGKDNLNIKIEEMSIYN